VHGLQGDCKVAGPSEHFRPGLKLIARRTGKADASLSVERAGEQRGHVRVRFHDVGDATAAQSLRGAALYADIQQLPQLQDGQYRVDELLGMSVIDDNLGDLGAVVDVAKYPSCDMLFIGATRRMVPLLAAYGVQVDRDARTISTALPPGFDDIA
jgi:16S rRNA processing protein RimM